MDKLKAALLEYPIRVRAVVGIITAVVGAYAVFAGADAANFPEQVSNGLVLLLEMAVVAGFIKKSEAEVTPMSNPKTDDGVPLVPVEPTHYESEDH